MSILLGFNKICILGISMRPLLFILIFTFSKSLFGESTPKSAENNALAGCGTTLTNIWSNFNNQAGLAHIKDFTIGLGSENKFLVNELSTHIAAFAFPVNGGVFGLNVTYTGFELYNETKLGLAFGKKLSKNFNVGIQVDYLGTYIDKGTNNTKKLTTMNVKRK